jgi:BirA family transcriptional regulator, biotin operon repressor / biotin---[acetyl-CoA-carboxylase] ligase
VNHALLDMLRGEDAAALTIRRISRGLSISAVQVRADIEELRRAGYLVEAGETGIRWIGLADRLIPAEIMANLGTRTVGRHVVAAESTPSTNDEAWALYTQGAPEGTVFLAEEQTLGRGRFGRRWLCPRRSGVLMSVLLQPGPDPARSSALTVMGAVAAVEVLNDRFRLPAMIKWPNDIVVGGRKLGGVLVESRTRARRGSAFVLGIGLNVNATQRQLPPELLDMATSVRIVTRHKADRILLAREVLRRLDRWYDDVRQGRYDALSQEWYRYSATLGERVVLEEDGRRFAGRVIEHSIEAGLILRLDRGGTRLFDPGRVTVVSSSQV